MRKGKRTFFAGVMPSLLNLGFAVFLVLSAFHLGRGIPGFPSWAYALAGLVFLSLAPGSFRWMRILDGEVLVGSWRGSIRIPFDDIEEIVVIPRRISLLTRKTIHYSAIKGRKGRKAWTSSWNFAFPKEAFDALKQAMEEKGLEFPEIVFASDAPAMKRSFPFAGLGLCLAVLGAWLFLRLYSEHEKIIHTLEKGKDARAVLVGTVEKEGYVDVTLELSGKTRSMLLKPGWEMGRKKGDLVEVLVHPEDEGFFIVKDERAMVSDVFLPSFIALVLIVLGGRTFVRASTYPTLELPLKA